MPALITGADGLSRCGWSAGDALYTAYHDDEWGRPLHGDRALFEKLSLEGFQAGLSWILILKRRETFRSAFAGFDPDTVAAMTEDDVDRLMLDPGIIRNRAKIRATISNAAIVRDLIHDSPGALDGLIWSHAPKPKRAPSGLTALPATTPESEALSRELRKLGLRFVGPTTMYALMQSAGLVDDHIQGCWRARHR
jgi:DNA-3-methyladenine glycosylase I